jgi:hypothetical protein
MEACFVRSAAVEKRELSKIDFEMIDDAFKAPLQSSHPHPVVEAKIVDLRDSFATLLLDGWKSRRPLSQRSGAGRNGQER